ncbi:MAG: TetR/AcrR family transcriptional regulator [Spirochaetales bacterium]|uniref:Biofilm operon icaADBC HTH-type negative transcriptional regulator IcaR n=1 Tax=Candidatus Thalassospirochaeta sargassi TaxID=3119039 RepID=A0AAJ1MJZ2_9SPIO|nr:TetR/AcrR family transcriptional regulator [Spirochaetales bacterium]
MGRKSKADERRPEILEHAYQVVKREGLENTTLAKIAEDMGVATSLLTHYYKSKIDIIESLGEYLSEKYNATVEVDFSKIEDPQQRLNAVLDARFWEYKNDEPDDKVWYDVYNLSLRNDRIKKSFTEFYENDLKLAMNDLEAALNGATGGVNREDLGTALLMMMEGIGYYNSIMSEKQDISGAAEVMKDMVLTYLDKLKEEK